MAFTIEEKMGDLFKGAGSKDCLAHCISADLRMERGIAIPFKQQFGGVSELEKQIGMAEGNCGEEEAVLKQSFVSALRKKYSYDEPLSIEIFIPKSAPGKTEGGELILPDHLALNYSSVAEAGLMAEIADVVANVTELDLSMNLLSQWSEVFKIISFLPRIHFLNLSNNPLHLSDVMDLAADSFPGIKQLVLNAAGVSWKTIWNLLSAMPQIQELHLSLNGFPSVEPTVDCTFPNVTDLYMNGSNISRWEEVKSLGKIFPGLTNLVMMEIPLSELTGEKPEANFCSLKSLNLGNTKISSWTELEKLRSFPCLTDVKLHGIPFLESFEEKLRRVLIIGYLPNVERLNGSPVSKAEREAAERAFIRHYMVADDPPTRYNELVAIHGQLTPLVDIDFSITNSVAVMVYYQDKSHIKNFDIYSTASDVKKVLAKELVNQPPRAFDLYHHDRLSDGHEIMRFLQRTLLGYHVKDGDEIYVELKKRDAT